MWLRGEEVLLPHQRTVTTVTPASGIQHPARTLHTHEHLFKEFDLCLSEGHPTECEAFRVSVKHPIKRAILLRCSLCSVIPVTVFRGKVHLFSSVIASSQRPSSLWVRVSL